MGQRTACLKRVRAGLTLVECLLAMLILSIAVLGITYATTAGHQHLHYADSSLRAVRLAENLIEEIQSRPYFGHGADRPTFHVDDYDNLHEAPGSLKDCNAVLYDAADQVFSRSASVTDTTTNVPDLENAAMPCKTVVVTVHDAFGDHWQLSRLIFPPVSP